MDDKEFKYEVEKGSQTIIDSKGNSAICLSKVSWNGGPMKLELRKWVFKGNDMTPMRGVSFLTDKGPHILTETLVKQGYGDTVTLKQLLNKRTHDNVDNVSHAKYTTKDVLKVIKKS